MSITNVSKPTTSLTNNTRIGIGITWAERTNSWASETLTWGGTASKVSNTSKPRSLGSYTFDEIGTRIISETGSSMSDSSFMINESKP